MKQNGLLEAAALQLSPAERARLVDRLIATLEVDPEVEEAWAAEVERRQSEIENGTISLRPGPETLANVRAEFEQIAQRTRMFDPGRVGTLGTILNGLDLDNPL